MAVVFLFGIVLVGIFAVVSGVRLWRVRPNTPTTKVALRAISLLLLLFGSWLLIGAVGIFIQPF